MDDLNGLVSKASALDAEYVAEGSAEPVSVAGSEASVGSVVDPVSELRDVITFSVRILSKLYPSLAAVYTDSVVAQLASAGAPLMSKYGWTVSGIFERWAPELNFAIVAWPVVEATTAAIRNDRGKNASTEKEPSESRKD